MKPLLAQDFQVPRGLTHREFLLRPLTAADAANDYEAVMESQERLRAGSPNGWPRKGFTLAENRADLEKHEAEFSTREAFAYTVVDNDARRTLGCVYVNPSTVADADVYLWVRDADADRLTATLFEAVHTWLKHDWPFRQINYVRRQYYPGLVEGGEAGE